MIGVGSTVNQVERSPKAQRKLSPEIVTSPSLPSRTTELTRPCHSPFPSRLVTRIFCRVPIDG